MRKRAQEEMVDPETLKACPNPNCGADWTTKQAVYVWPYASDGIACHVNESQPDAEGLELTSDESDVHLETVECAVCGNRVEYADCNIGLWLLVK